MSLPLNSISVLIQVRVFPNYVPKDHWEINAIKDLLKRGYIKGAGGKNNDNYQVTEKGRCFVDYVAEIPEPVNTWTITPKT